MAHTVRRYRAGGAIAFLFVFSSAKAEQTARNWNRPSSSVPFCGYRLWDLRACGSPGSGTRWCGGRRSAPAASFSRASRRE